MSVHDNPKTVVVTGGSGFVGSNLATHLADEGYEVFATYKKGEQEISGTPGIEVIDFEDLLSNVTWRNIGKVYALLHQGANTNTLDQNERRMRWSNFEYSRELFLRGFAKGVKRFVFASSTAIYGNSQAPYIEGTTQFEPLNAYARSKIEFEDWVITEFLKRTKETTVVGLRYCNVYGPGEEHKAKVEFTDSKDLEPVTKQPRIKIANMSSMIYQLIQQMIQGDPKLFEGCKGFEAGEQKRDYIYIEDVVNANITAMESGKQVVMNCGSGVATSFNRLVEIINQGMLIRNIIPNPRKPIYMRFAEKNTDPEKYQAFTQCDMTLAGKEIGFTPQFTIEQGIETYLDYITQA